MIMGLSREFRYIRRPSFEVFRILEFLDLVFDMKNLLRLCC